jgi:ATP-dependent Lon protease
MPGKIIKGLKGCKGNNPLILLDEIDKMGHDFRSDPESALLEVLDHQQNATFTDNYLEVGYDLSKVLFLCTANTLEMSPPLKDRLEFIMLNSYSKKEKLNIATKHLIPQIKKNNGLKSEEFEISDEAIEYIIERYASEAGVRQLGIKLEQLARRAVRKIDESLSLEEENISIPTEENEENLQEKNIESFPNETLMAKTTLPLITSLCFTPEMIVEELGAPITDDVWTEHVNGIGICTGLAWTQFGGEVLTIETVLIPGKGEIVITGQLGDVMKESVRAAWSFARSQAEIWNMSFEKFTTHDIHIHVPEGATPKDGPSAGIALCTALVSCIKNEPTPPYVAMTGEITLSGRILSIGGLKEKLLAAVRGNIKTVFIPKGNEKDLNDIRKENEEIFNQLKIISVSIYHEIYRYLFLEKNY